MTFTDKVAVETVVAAVWVNAASWETYVRSGALVHICNYNPHTTLTGITESVVMTLLISFK